MGSGGDLPAKKHVNTGCSRLSVRDFFWRQGDNPPEADLNLNQWMIQIGL